MKRQLLVIAFAAVIGVTGCSTPSAYREVMKDNDPSNVRDYPVGNEALYTAALKTFLAKKFVIENENQAEGSLIGKRSVQEGKTTVVLLTQARIIASGSDRSSLYLNAIETTEREFVADRTRFFLFVIPLPGGGGKQATTVKEGERAVEDKKFYNELFASVEKEIALATATR